MTHLAWQPVRGMDFRKLHDARLQAHYATQWLARAARAYVAPQPDDRHTSLGWDEAHGCLATHPLPDGSRVGLNVAELSLSILGYRSEILSLDGRADAEVRRWLGERLAARGLDARKLDAPPPYAMPHHVLAHGARYSIEELTDQFATLSTWFANATGALSRVRQRVIARKLKAPEVRCWPHHFDLDSLVPLGRGRTMGLGWCPGDDYCDEPYFYLSMYPEPVIPRLPLLPPQGHWHSYQFLAAMAPAHKIVVAGDQGGYVDAFLNFAVDAALDAMKGN
jgi:hypothetical protein